MKQLLWQLWQDESGQDLVEYALILTFLSLAALASIGPLGTTLSAFFTNANSNFPQ